MKSAARWEDHLIALGVVLPAGGVGLLEHGGVVGDGEDDVALQEQPCPSDDIV